MKIPYQVSIGVLFLSFACSMQANAQRNDSLLKDNRIEVIKNFKPILSDAIKIPTNPNPEKPEYVKQEFKYDLPEKIYQVQPTIYTIKPLSMGTMLLPKLKGNYMRVGYGNYAMPLAELYLNTVRNKQYQAGVFLKHLSGNGDANYNAFSGNTAHGYVKKINAKSNLGMDVYYHRNRINLYGTPNDTAELSHNPDITYNLYDVKTHYSTTDKDSAGLAYRIDLNYYHFNNSSWYNENDIAIKVGLNKKSSDIPFELISGLRLNNNLIKNSQGDWVNYQRIFFDLNPQVFLNDKDYYLKGGFNSTISSDSAGSNFHFYPKAEGAYKIVRNKLLVYAGLSGRYTPNTYRSFWNLNPFVNEMLLKNTIHQIEIYGGFKGEIGPLTNFQISSTSATVKNLLCFSQDSAGAYQIALFDEGKSKMTTLSADIQHQWNEKFRLGFSANIYGYKLKNLARAYGLPQFEAKINSTYNIADKFLMRFDILYWGERYGRVEAKRADGTFASFDKKMLPFVDANMGIDYRYSKNLSAFLNLNNLANSRYQRYFNYPVYGINVMGGFTFTF